MRSIIGRLVLSHKRAWSLAQGEMVILTFFPMLAITLMSFSVQKEAREIVAAACLYLEVAFFVCILISNLSEYRIRGILSGIGIYYVLWYFSLSAMIVYLR